ncbi:MAG: GAF domain-containing protein [Anaerolineales bacterium]|nr:GAF domain-containing protein [Anaerolineales bacterium]
MLYRYGLRTDDPFAAPSRWLLRLGLRFYYPVAVVGVTLIIALVVRDAFRDDDFRRRLVILMMLGAACVFVLFWRAERLWLRGDRGWLVRLARPDQALAWAGVGVAVVALGLAAATRLLGAGPVADYLWLLFLFPLLYLSERGRAAAFALVTGAATLFLILLRLAAGYPLLEVALPPLWLSLLAASNYYLAHRYLLLERRAEILRGIANELSNTPDVDADLQRITGLIASRLRYDHLRLWLADEAGALSLRAAAGLPAGRALEAGHIVSAWPDPRLARWDNLGRGQRPAPWARSAVSAPILAEGRPVGLLEALSPREAEFWEYDEEQLARMADSVGLALARSRAVQREAARLRDTLAEVVSRLGDCTSLPEMFEVIAHDARTRLAADSVILYPLAPGTGYPLAPLTAGDLRGAPPAAASPALLALIAAWTAVYGEEAPADPRLAGLDFLPREGLAAVVCLPMGTRTERVGALLLNFRAPRRFSPLEKLTLEAFASLAAEQINRERAHWRKYEAFGGVLFGVHGPLTLSADALRRLIGSAQTAASPELAAQALANAQTVVRRLEIAAMLTRLSRRDPAEAASFHDEVRRAAQKITGLAEPAQVRVDIPPEADDLPFAVLDAVYCLALEAVANASFHGGARCIDIEVDVTPAAIRLNVADDGHGFDVAAARPGPHGIFEGLALAAEQFAAEGAVASAPGAGTRLDVAFPLLP